MEQKPLIEFTEKILGQEIHFYIWPEVIDWRFSLGSGIGLVRGENYSKKMVMDTFESQIRATLIAVADKIKEESVESMRSKKKVK